MYAVVRHYKGATRLVDFLAQHEREAQQVMGGIPGVVAYYQVRSADGGLSITICQDQAGTTESGRRAAEWLRQNYPEAASITPPEVIEGEVFFNLRQ
jgi:hypothetical protein